MLSRFVARRSLAGALRPAAASYSTAYFGSTIPSPSFLAAHHRMPRVNSLTLRKITVSSTFEAVDIPKISLPEYMLDSFKKFGDKTALIDGSNGFRRGQSMTYAQLANTIKTTAAGLQRIGFQRGDTLLIHSLNSLDYVVMVDAALLAGGKVSTASPLFTSEELVRQMWDCGATHVATHPDVEGVMKEALAEFSDIKNVWSTGPYESEEGYPKTDTLMKGLTPDDYEDVSIDPFTVALVPYSSGTTGLPKGVMLTHHNLVANAVQTKSLLSLDDREMAIAVLPFFHIFGLQVLLHTSLAAGIPQVVMERFDLATLLFNIQEHRVTQMCLAPPILLALAKHPMVDDYNLSSLKFLLSGAAPLSESLQREAMERLNAVVVQGYGMTELSPVTHGNSYTTNREGSVGRLLPHTEAKVICAETGAGLPANKVGEVWIRGPQVMLGYLNREDATKETVVDGWLRTGDVGYYDEDGFFFITDRLKELIKVKGFQVAPAELEGKILTHPSVADVAVIPVLPNPERPEIEVPKAFIVFKAGKEVPVEEVQAFVNAKLPDYKHIVQIEQRDAIPKAASGKILRRVLRDEEKAKHKKSA